MLIFQPLEERKNSIVPVPLTCISIYSTVHNSLTTVKISQTFTNEEDNPIECDYLFPTLEEAVITDLKIRLLDGTVLISIIEETENAKEKYQDAVSSGKTVVMSKQNNFYQVKVHIGNLAPKDSIVIEFTIAYPLISDQNYWKFIISAELIPLKKISSVPDFEFFIEIHSDSPVIDQSSNLKLSWESSLGDTNLTGRLVESFTEPQENMIWVKFRAENISVPSCILQKLGSRYASMMSFIPYVDNSMSIDDIEGNGEFLFLLDRSASMANDRIELAKHAAMLFLKSLPIGSKFNIISFGSKFKLMFNESQDNSSENVKYAALKISEFEADLGGTEIYKPLEMIFQSKPLYNYPRIIFLLTDGGVRNATSVVELIKEQAGLCRVHAFGIGRGVDHRLLEQSAKAGGGAAYFVSNTSEIGQTVISALKNCVLPCINNWEINWPGESLPPSSQIGNVYYGERVVQYVLMESFPSDNLAIRFYDSSKAQSSEYLLSSFKEIPGEQIFQLWAKHKIESLQKNPEENKEKIINISKEFKIPSNFTSFICITGNEFPVQGDLQQRKIGMNLFIKEKKLKGQVSSSSGSCSSPSSNSSSVLCAGAKMRNAGPCSSDENSDESQSSSYHSNQKIKASKNYRSSSSSNDSRNNIMHKMSGPTAIKDLHNNQPLEIKNASGSSSSSYSDRKSPKNQDFMSKMPCPVPKKEQAKPRSGSSSNSSCSGNDVAKSAQPKSRKELNQSPGKFSSSGSNSSVSIEKVVATNDEKVFACTTEINKNQVIKSRKSSNSSSNRSSASNDSDNEIPKTIKFSNQKPTDCYMNVILAQETEGFWKLEAICGFLPRVLEVPKEWFSGYDNEFILATVFVLCYLHKFYETRIGEWELVEKKALRWMRRLAVRVEVLREKLNDYL